MANEKLRWEKLDNTAFLFPAIAGESMTNTYRISVTLTEEVDADVLQQAVDLVTPKFPGFNQRLRSGFFWYYFEENGKPAPRVRQEDAYPCRFIHANRNHSYLFRVTYYKKRINLEVFHAIADGMGGLGFLKEITYQYLRLLHPEIGERIGDGLHEDTSLDREDSFLRNYRKGNKSIYKSGKAFLLKGEKLPYHGFGLVHGYMSVSELKDVSKNTYGCSINEYLISAFIFSTYQENRGEVSADRPIRVAVPVNLRPFFASQTTKNFFAMVSAEFGPTKREYTFAEIIGIVKKSLREQITKENLEEIFSYNVSNQEHLIARVVPLPLKNLAMRFVYRKSALANTTTITNMGNVTVTEEYTPYIRGFYCFLSFSKGQNTKAAIMSYGDEMVFTFSSAYKETAVQKGVFRQIAVDGIRVEIETNGVY